MKVVILAGGRGKRLGRPDIPKPMVELSGTPLLEKLIKQLVSFGIFDLYITVGYKRHIIENYFGDGTEFNCKVTYLCEESPLGTAGSVIKNKHIFDEPFLVVYGDLLLDINWKNFVEIGKNNGGLATLFCHPNSHPFDSDLLNVDENSKIIEIYRKPHNDLAALPNLSNAAIYYLDPDILTYFDTRNLDWAHDIFPALLSKGNIYAYNSLEYACDVGTPERLAKGEEHVKLNLPQKLRKCKSKPVVFLDRDGVINKEIGGVLEPKEIKIYPGVAKAIKRLNNLHIPVLCITNQPLIAKGKITERQLIKINNRISSLLAQETGAFINDWFYCPHHPERGWPGEIECLKILCECRKPKPGLFLAASHQHGINLNRSFMVGDRYCDIEAANLAGVKSILVATGHSGIDKDKFPDTVPDYEVKTLLEAVDLLENSIDYYTNTFSN